MVRVWVSGWIIILALSLTPLLPILAQADELEVHVHVDTLLPNAKAYRLTTINVILTIHNILEETVYNVTVSETSPFSIVYSSYNGIFNLEPDESKTLNYIFLVPGPLGPNSKAPLGPCSIVFNISYATIEFVGNETIIEYHSMTKEVIVEVVPRNYTFIPAYITWNESGYYLVVSNPIGRVNVDNRTIYIDLQDQYVVENITVTLNAEDVTLEPSTIFIRRLYYNKTIHVPLTIRFKENDIALANITVRGVDDIHGPFTYTFTQVLVNVTTKLKLIVTNDKGDLIDEAQIILKLSGTNKTYQGVIHNGVAEFHVFPGIYKYWITWDSKTFTGRLIVGSGVYTYYIVLDATSPIIEVIEQKGFGVRIKASDPNVNATGITTITFSQNDRNYTYTLYPQKSIDVIFYPPLEQGTYTIYVIDGHNNSALLTSTYILPKVETGAWEILLVSTIAVLVLASLALVTGIKPSWD